MIVCQRKNTELVPCFITDKIAGRDATLAVRVNTISNEIAPAIRMPPTGFRMLGVVSGGLRRCGLE